MLKVSCPKREDSKIQAMEMKFLKGIFGKTRKNKIRNTVIREELKIEEIKRDIEKTRLQWYGHVMHMPEDRIPKRMLQTELRRKRPMEDQMLVSLDEVLHTYIIVKKRVICKGKVSFIKICMEWCRDCAGSRRHSQFVVCSIKRV
ncbi:hypothetical protein C0J52_09106 [Blattella germanica]|nr:hypothetical protein C0J52_09106 [Blattella germanica]